MTAKSSGKAKACALCSHADRRVFDEAITKATPLEQIAVGWSLPLAAVRRHRGHVALPASFAEKVQGALDEKPGAEPRPPRREAVEPPPSDAGPSTASDTVTRVLAQIERILKKAETDPEVTYAEQSAMLRAATQAANLLARIRGESAAVTEASIAKHPAFLRIVAALTKALAPWPEAKAAAVVVLERLDGQP